MEDLEQAARDFIHAVEVRMHDCPAVFKQFVRTLNNYDGRSSTEIAHCLQVILSGHVDLLLQMNQFVPESCQLRREELELDLDAIEAN